MADLPAFGIAWAPAGEDRPARWRTPIGWATGVGDGVLLVQNGPDETHRRWLLMSEWLEWVADSGAAVVVSTVSDAAADVPWSDENV